MDPMASIRETFFQECDEQLAALEAGLALMEEGATDPDTVNAVFRAVHSIKGGAGAFKLNELVGFAHVFETALDRVRSGTLPADASLMKLMLKSVDVLSDLVNVSREHGATVTDIGDSVVEEFNQVLGGGNAQAEEVDEFADIDFTPTTISFDDMGSAPVASTVAGKTYKIKFRPFNGLFEKANEPQLLLRELERLGQMSVVCHMDALPGLAELDPNNSHFSWTIDLTTEAPLSAIQEVFEFVDGDCELSVVDAAAPPPAADLPDIEALLNKVRSEAIPEPEPTPAPLVEATPAATTAAAQDPKAPLKPVAAAASTIRVDLERVDRLINLVGELVINQAMLSQRVQKGGYDRSAEVSSSLEELEHLTRDLQESVMAIRAQPVKPLFQRMARIIREVADATGKEVRLKTEGDATEIDKTVIELLADPLTHMIRNGVDHGLEKPEDRIAAGKPSEGVIRLTAAHRSGRVVIEVSDDGAGINRAKVLESAKRKGLVPVDANLSDTEIDNLLFLPGFSTAATVSSISGRGVGMDVVKRSIQALGGRITISSKPKIGSTFSLSLPLTLAVLDGIVVAIDDQTFVVPLTAIVETLQPNAAEIHPLGEGSFVIRVRDAFVPLIDVGAEIGIRPRSSTPPKGVAILVETENRVRNALFVDSIIDQRQVVIKSLETNYGKATGVAAATILGDGRVAMILDVDALISSQRGDTPLA
jgi:two-component system chemotaxis sensor kinase CheA